MDNTRTRALRAPLSSHLPCYRPDRRTTALRAVSSNKQVDELLSQCGQTDRGVSTSKEVKQSVLESVEALSVGHKGATTTGSALSACWKLVWTTEKVC